MNVQYSARIFFFVEAVLELLLWGAEFVCYFISYSVRSCLCACLVSFRASLLSVKPVKILFLPFEKAWEMSLTLFVGGMLLHVTIVT